MATKGRKVRTGSPVLEVFRTLHRLKELPRQGFVYFGFKGDETDSVADHSFMVTWLTYLLAHECGLSKRDTAKATLMALVHDWGEAVAGDLSYRAKGAAFARTERRAFTRLVRELRGKDIVTELWREYESKSSFLAALVKLADALDAWLQGVATTTTWWPAWEDYNRSVYQRLRRVDRDLAEKFRRMCDMARDPNVQVWLPDPDPAVKDGPLWNILRFVKQVYTLKELPRHGFTMFGMKRSETDSFAAHSFCTASLAFLVGLECFRWKDPLYLSQPVMVALCHDLPVALTGDAAYDLQRSAQEDWDEMSRDAVERLVGILPFESEVKQLHEMWQNPKTPSAWIAKVAAAVDAWEMGVTTPSSWMDAWLDYRKDTEDSLTGAPIGRRPILQRFLDQAYEDLSAFEDVFDKNGTRVGRQPSRVKPIRLTRPRKPTS